MATNGTPTQVARPGRATFRTIVQTAIPTILVLGLVVPEVVQIVLEETGGTMPDGLRTVLLGASAVVVAVAAILTRIMAIPQVEDFLRRHHFLESLAAEPDDGAQGRQHPADVARRTESGHADLTLVVATIALVAAVVACALLLQLVFRLY